jgi:hypothetical protein
MHTGKLETMFSGKSVAYSKHCTFEINYSIDLANNKVTSYLSHKSQEGTKVT